MGNWNDRGGMCIDLCVCAYINKKNPRSSTENKKLNTWRTKPKINIILRIYFPILLHRKTSKHNRAKESIDTTHCTYSKTEIYEIKFLCCLSFSLERQSLTWKLWKSFLRTIKQVEVYEPMHWLFHVHCWQTFKNQLSSKAVKSMRIFTVSFSFLTLLVCSSPCIEN